MSLLNLLPYSWHSPYTTLLYLFSVSKTITTTLITSRLDYCNSLLYNISSKDIGKLSCVQNCLAKVVTWSLSVSLLKSLHWLNLASFSNSVPWPIKLSSGGPSYLLSMLSLAPKLIVVSSFGFHLLSVPRVKTHAGMLFQLLCLLFGTHSLRC